MIPKNLDLAEMGLLSTEAPPVEAAPAPADEADAIQFVTQTLLSMQDSLGSMQIGLRIMNERIAGLERYVAYLLEKDPIVGPKLKAQADKEEAVAKANAEAEAAKAPGQGT